MNVDKIKKYLVVFMVVILLLNIFNPFLSLIGAEGDSKETTETEPAEVVGLLEMGDFNLVKENFEYDEGLHKKMTLEFLKITNMYQSDFYKGIFDGSRTINEGQQNYTNIAIQKILMADTEGVDSLTEGEKGSKGVFRIPIRQQYEGKLKDVESGKNGSHGSALLSHLVFKEEKMGKNKAFHLNTNDYVVYVGNKTKYIDLTKLQAFSSYYVSGIGGQSAIIIPNKDFYVQGGFYNYYYHDVGMEAYQMRVAFKKYNSEFESLNDTLFLDSYGNIVTNKSAIIIPYWMNSAVPDLESIFADDKVFLSNHFVNVPNYMTDEATYLFKERAFFREIDEAESSSILSGNANLVSEFNSLFSEHKKNKKNTPLEEENTTAKKIAEIYKNDAYLNVIADYIVDITADEVKKHNANMIDMVENTGEISLDVIIDESSAFKNSDGTIENIDDATKYIQEAGNILAKIGRILEIGFFELLRLTIAGFVSDFYNSNVIRFSVSDVFHTSLLSDSALWGQIVNTILLLTVSFTGVYVAYLSLRMFIGSVTPKEIMMKIIILAIAVASPMILYSPIVNLIFNVPAEKILNTEMNRMLVLDTWLLDKENQALRYEEETGYKMSSVLRDRNEDYTVQFATQTTVEGLPIQSYVSKYGVEPSLNQIVTVDVAVGHIAHWLAELQEYNISHNNSDDTVDNSDNPTTSTIDADTTLFEFLNDNYREYQGIDQYEEYEIAIGEGLKGIGAFESEATEHITASSLLAEIHEKYNSYETPVNDNLYKLTEELFYDGRYCEKEEEGNNCKTDDSGNIIFSNSDDSDSTILIPYEADEIEMVISELSMPGGLRKEIFTTDPGKFDDTGNGSLYVHTLLAESGSEVEYPISDFLMLNTILDPMKGVRFDKTIELGSEVQHINRQVIEKYSELYLPLRKSIFKSSNSTPESYARSESVIIELETFFAISDYYGLGLFPRGVNIENISLDTYVRTMFIPLSKFKPEEKALDDVSEFIALSTDLFSLLVFLCAIVGLFIYGLIKFIVIFVLLMPAILISFFMNYVVKNDVNNKAWLGSLTILGSFALVNLGLLGVWKGLIYAMNLNDLNKALQFTTSGYPYVLTNSAAILLYLFLVFKFILKPLFNTVKGDLRNLGGETFSEKFGDLSAGFSKTLAKMWNGDFGGSKGTVGEIGGSVDVNNDSKANKGISDTDTGKAGDMGIVASSDSSVSENDKAALDLINSKLEGKDDLDLSTTSNPDKKTQVHNVLNGAKDKSTVNNVKSKVGNKVSDSVSGIRGVIGNTAYNVLSKTGKLVGGTTGELLGSSAGNAIRSAITGQLGEISTGANAAHSIAQLTSSGIGATIAGGVLGGLLGRASAKVKSPFTLMQAKAMASKLNNLKMKEDKYSKLNNLDEEDLEKLKVAGLDTRLESLDGLNTNRDSELMFIETGDSVVSGMVAENLDDNIGAEHLGDKLILNLDSDEIQDQKTLARLYNDLLVGVAKSKTDIVSQELNLSELGTSPLASYIDDNKYSFGELGEYQDVFEKLVRDYELQGTTLDIVRDANGMVTVDFGDSGIDKEFLSEFETRSSSLASMMNTEGPIYSMDEGGAKLLKLLKDNNIEYDVLENSEEFGVAVQLTDAYNDGLKLQELLEDNKDLASNMLELTTGHLKSTDDLIVSKLMREYTDSNELQEGVDVVYRDNDVIAVSARAKKVMSTIQERYDEERSQTLAKLDDFTGKIKESLLNIEEGYEVEGGLQFGIHDRTSMTSEAAEIERMLRNSSVGKEHYVMRNNYDIGEMETFVSDIQSRRYDILNNDSQEQLLKQEEELLDIVARMKSRGVIMNRHDDSTLSIYSENKEDAELVKSYFEAIKEVEHARVVQKRVMEQQVLINNTNNNSTNN